MVTKQVQYKEDAVDKNKQPSLNKSNSESQTLAIQKAREKSAILSKAREIFSQQVLWNSQLHILWNTSFGGRI
eukprot:XP_766271.1 hypothetical protein [Theileria parva strain Muguga]